MHDAVDEVLRVQEHLAGAEAFAATRTLELLDPAQRLTRALLLDELARYRGEGVFPKNRDFAGERRPYFIDADGTRCAMAHLMEIGGAAELVAEVARTNNNAYVEELASDPRVVAWLRAAGLTVEEAARIQPSYCYTPPSYCVCAMAYGDFDAGTVPLLVYEATVLSASEGEGRASVRVDAVHAGAAGASSVGTERTVMASVPLKAGERILAALGPERSPDAAVVLLGEGDAIGASCLIRGGLSPYSKLPPLSKEEALEVVSLSAAACRKALAIRDPRWNASECEGSGMKPAPAPAPDASTRPAEPAAAPSEPGGCQVVAASSDGASVLIAVLTALAIRRSALRLRAGR